MLLSSCTSICPNSFQLNLRMLRASLPAAASPKENAYSIYFTWDISWPTGSVYGSSNSEVKAFSSISVC